MAKADFRVKDGHRWSANPYNTKAGQTAIKAGELVCQDVSGDEEYVLAAADGTCTDNIIVGVAVSNDTNSASTDGIVYVVDASDAIFIGKATTWSNVTKAVMNTKVTVDVAATVQTIDENDVTKGALLMLDFDSARKEVYFKIKESIRLNA